MTTLPPALNSDIWQVRSIRIINLHILKPFVSDILAENLLFLL